MNVRPVGSDEAARLRELRLRALRDAPGAFLTTAVEAEGRPAAFWEDQARRSGQGEEWRIFVAEGEGGEWCGMAAVSLAPNWSRVAELFQMWVEPSCRRHGIGRQLVEAALVWAGGCAERLRLGVASDNPGAQTLYETVGFVATGEEVPFEGRPGVVVRYFERRLEGSVTGRGDR